FSIGKILSRGVLFSLISEFKRQCLNKRIVVDIFHTYVRTIKAYDDVRLTAGLQRSPGSNQVSGQGEYTAERAVVRLDHQSNFHRDGARTSHLTAAGLSTALVWAGSSVSVSRPVSDSFVILPAKGAARGEKILV